MRKTVGLMCLVGVMAWCSGWGGSASAETPDPLLQVRPAERITVMTYNVENMFDIFDDPYTGDEGTPVKRREAVQRIARAIEAGSPDVVIFQEIENEFVIAQMAHEFLSDMGYRYILCPPTNSGRGIDLGIMSRYPIKRMASYRLREFRHPDDGPSVIRGFSRDVMHATIDVGHDRPLEVLNVHLKSNSSREGDPYSMKQRTAEAMELKRITREIIEADSDAWVVVGGDFNSDYERRPQDERDWPATAHLLETDADGTRLLTDLHAGQPRSERITLPSKGRFPSAVFDFVLASPALAKRVVRGSAQVVSNEAFTGGSDHLPVFATFQLGN
ncbi:MAG: endonuclease/exonuclease/phosphatase family protein [Planctomycetota bacterium]